MRQGMKNYYKTRLSDDSPGKYYDSYPNQNYNWKHSSSCYDIIHVKLLPYCLTYKKFQMT